MDTFIEFGNIIISFSVIVCSIFVIVVAGQIGMMLGIALILYAIIMLFQTEEMKSETLDLVDERKEKEAVSVWANTFVIFIILSIILFLVIALVSKYQ